MSYNIAYSGTIDNSCIGLNVRVIDGGVNMLTGLSGMTLAPLSGSDTALAPIKIVGLSDQIELHGNVEVMINNSQFRTGTLNASTDINPISTSFPLLRAAISNTQAGLSNTIAVCVGDSTTGGVNSNGGLLFNSRTTAYPSAFAGFVSSQIHSARASSVNGNQALNLTDYVSYNPEVSFANPANWSLDGSTFGGNLFRANATNSRMIWTPTGTTDTFEFLYPIVPGIGTISVYFNGSATPVETFSAAGTLGLGKKTYTVPSGTNSIEIARTAGGVIFVASLTAYNSAQKQVLIFNGGLPSGTAASIASNGAPYEGLGMITALQPDMTFIVVGLNDFTPDTPQAVFEAAYGSLVDAGLVTGDVVAVLPNDINHVNQAKFNGYIANVAAAKGIALMDMRTALGTLAQATANGYMQDPVHPNNIGYSLEAQYLCDMITS